MEKVPTHTDLRSMYDQKLLNRMKSQPAERKPIYKGCNTLGQCFCTGECKEVIGWEDVKTFPTFVKL